MTPACQYLSDATDVLVEEFGALIDRHFAAERVLVVERESAKHWTAAIGDTVLYRSPSQDATMRFAVTFADRTPGVLVDLRVGRRAEVSAFSVRVPSNVVPIRTPA